MDLKETIIILIILISLIFIFETCSHDSSKAAIQEKVKSINGEIINIEEKSVLFSDTPFSWNTKEMRIYRFTYKVNNEEKVGWVRFKAFSNDWKMDYKEEL